jgi:hypothetical protein
MTIGKGNANGFGIERDRDAEPEGDGAVINESGFAFVREGETIFPRLDSRAQAELAVEDTRMTVTINLPVIVQVHGTNDSGETDRIVDEAMRRLRNAVEALG